MPVAALQKRACRIENFACPCDHTCAAHLVVVAAADGSVVLRDRVRAVERIIERAPPGIGGIERIAGVRQRHNQLWAGDVRDLVIYIQGTNCEVRWLRRQISDVAQKFFILGDIKRPTPLSAVKVVDTRLQHVTEVEQLAIARSEVAYDRAKPVPEAFDRDPRSG